MIDIINVEQTFGDRRILKNVNLQINKGETMVILGASGSGKSTLLKMMIGLLKPTSGKILIDGRDITKMPET
ncbi:ATP-binding cassette domain-containing protein, partial [Dialister hominis]